MAGRSAGIAVDAGRHQRWLDILGDDHWSVTAGGWVLLAINAQLLGSGLAAEAAQWSWLDGPGRHRGRQPVALITHKPVTATGTELAAAPPYRFRPPQARDRLARLFGGTPPATWAVLPDQAQPVLGAKRCGIVSLTLTAGTPAQQELIEPDGLEQHTITVDVPDPYHN